MIRTLESQLLAMPAPMRCLLLQQAVYRPSYIPCRHLSSASSALNSPQPPQPPTTSSPQPPPSASAPLSFLPSPSNNPLRQPIPAAPVPPALLATATTILTTPPPRFLYSAPRFLNLPINARVPEICLLGRSNVGKSTLINALAGVASSSAGRSHGSAVSSAKRGQKSSLNANINTKKGGLGLAITSSKAGCTKTLNGYAFGLPPPNSRPQPPSVKPDLSSDQPKPRTSTRSARRLLASHNHDPTPSAALVLMDMPGYGQNSRSEWGAEIAKYLSRRRALRGAILLVDAVAGLKDGDRAVLRLLRDARVRVAVVLTKADKLGYGYGRDGEKGLAEVGRVCESVWDLLRDLERGVEGWEEGTGWEGEIWVTGAGDPRTGGVGVEGARFAIARMAGLVVDEREVMGRTAATVAERPKQRIVPFEELKWKTGSGSGRFEVEA